MPMLAPHIKSLDMVAVFMGDYEGGDVVSRQAKLIHTFKCLATRQAVVDHDEPLGAFDERAVAF